MDSMTQWIAVALAALVTVGMAIQVTGQQLDSEDWDVVMTYQFDNGTISNYTEQGTYDEYIDCAGTWSMVSNETKSVSQQEREVQFAFDLLTGEFAYLEIDNGTEVKRVSKCDLFTTPTVEGADGAWVTSDDACSGPNTHDERQAGDSAIAPTAPNPEDSYDASGDEGACYWISARAGGDLRFTGYLNIEPFWGLETDSGDNIATVNNWLVIGGEPWNDGVPDTNAFQDTSLQAEAAPGTEINGIHLEGSGYGKYGFEVYNSTG